MNTSLIPLVNGRRVKTRSSASRIIKVTNSQLQDFADGIAKDIDQDHLKIIETMKRLSKENIKSVQLRYAKNAEFNERRFNIKLEFIKRKNKINIIITALVCTSMIVAICVIWIMNM